MDGAVVSGFSRAMWTESSERLTHFTGKAMYTNGLLLSVDRSCAVPRTWQGAGPLALVKALGSASHV